MRSCALLLACLGSALALGVVARSATMRVPLSFRAPISYGGGGGFAFETGDLNRDGRPYLISGSLRGYVSVLLNHGRGRFGAPDIYETGGIVTLPRLADLDGNGSPDIFGRELRLQQDRRAAQ
jgi:hypothetical protein